MEDEPTSENPSPLHLTFEETRVLGCLLEKERTTPEYYPLTQNSLASACNQKSSRHPVTEFDDDVIDAALTGLRDRGLVMRVAVAGSRVPKYKHLIDDILTDLDDGTRAVLSVLLLRGQQTAGELKSRTERLHHFAELAHTQTAIDALIEQGLARMVPSGGGRRVVTFVHLLGDAPEVAEETTVAPGLATASAPAAAPAPASTPAAPSRDLAAEVDTLKESLATLRAEFDDLRSQLEG